MTSATDVVVIGAGQSGLAAARALQAHGISPVVLEAGPEPAGSWPRYYDSLTLFSPARYSAMPGPDFPGEPDHYPHRDEVVAYLRRYAASLGADIRTSTPVTAVEAHDRAGFLVHTATGQTFHAGVVAATGSFGNPCVPALPGQHQFTGRLLHVAGYRSPHQHAGERIIVVGAGNSAVQVSYELAQVATVTLATRHPVTFHPQCRGGQDLHHWLVTSGFDLLPPEWLSHYLGDRWVVDTGKYRHALQTGQMDRRPMFTAFGTDRVVWPDRTSEKVDTVIFATGYRPDQELPAHRHRRSPSSQQDSPQPPAFSSSPGHATKPQPASRPLKEIKPRSPMAVPAVGPRRSGGHLALRAQPRTLTWRR
jgi:putative flavoprotein involved in K+ transport